MQKSKNGYWKKRIDNVKKSVSMRQIIDFFRVACHSTSATTQVHCPFHSKDNHASARIYDTDTMYCWVCAKSWDVVSFVSDFKNFDFKKSLSFLEDAFNIVKLDVATAYENESFEDYLESSKNLKDYSENFSKIQNKLIQKREYCSFEQYSKLFKFYDNLYSKYSLKNFKNVAEIQQGIQILEHEINQI